ncbi:MAG: hypothetical protein KA314_19575 [Chloroflexi bacterium]|nr:hypothetical protein [Chloroflexota bacterium]MBP8058035.1 hypothetical protein [Chloroflexota bacterium]
MNRRQFLTYLTTAAASWLLHRSSIRLGGEFVLFMWSDALTNTSIRVKARLNLDSDSVRLVASTQPDLNNPIFTGYAAANSTNNRVASLNLSGLTTNTTYHYTIEAEGQRSSLRGRFHTPTSSLFSFSFACASCAQTGSDHTVFTTIQQNNPLFFIHLGDFHYQDIGSNDVNRFRQAFNTVLASSPRPICTAIYPWLTSGMIMTMGRMIVMVHHPAAPPLASLTRNMCPIILLSAALAMYS